MNTGKYIIIALACLFTFSFAGDFAKTFLRVPPDAASRSIGGANLALPIGAFDLFVNPALLIEKQQKELQFSNLIDINANRYFSAALSIPVSSQSQLGVGLVSRNFSDQVLLRQDNLTIREKIDSQFGVVVSYARKFRKVSLGVSSKYFNWQNSSNTYGQGGTAIGLDFGGVYQVSPGLGVGATYQQVLQFRSESSPGSFPKGLLSIGVAWSPVYLPRNYLKLLFSVNQFRGESRRLNAGVMFTPVAQKGNLLNFTLRAGAGNFSLTGNSDFSALPFEPDEIRRFTVGAGIGVRAAAGLKIIFDYCYQIQEYVSRQHIITTRIQF